MSVLGVFRTIIRHSRHIDDARINSDLKFLKRLIKNKKTSKVSPRQVRNGVKRLYQIEDGLRDVCLERCSIPKLREVWGRPTMEGIEKNQTSAVHLWLQHEERRFDKFNEPPARGSTSFLRVDRGSKFAVAASEFRMANLLAPKKHSKHENIQKKTAIETIFTPYYKSLQDSPQKSPRSVEIRSIKRSAGSLSLIRVGGIPMRATGFRRHVEEVDTRFYDRFELLQKQIWLAQEYSKDEFDGEDMTDWIEHLNDELKRQKRKLNQLTQKLEVQRRILARRRAEMETLWAYRFRVSQQNNERRQKLTPPKLLTLDSL